MKLAEDRGCQLSDLSTHDLQTINKLFEDDVQEVWNYNRYACCCQGTMIASDTVKVIALAFTVLAITFNGARAGGGSGALVP